ncbi:class I SAM-dependent methyltransferase [Streptosporangium sp. NPDC051022]|uniref:O-methyltransferase n=1 Tax=Streptosporangium sp. NPDC051022 TaxID=3155752 RepID=UPI00342378AD
MSLNGTDAYRRLDVPPLVARAVRLAESQGFPFSCRPEQGRLLRVLAGGARTSVAETGTGCGVGLAWLATGAPPEVGIIGVERDPGRAGAAAELFSDVPNVTVICGDWSAIYDHAPYDLVVLDGGGQGKNEGDEPADPFRLLSPGGTLVIDDFTPARTSPPLFGGKPDLGRLHWLEHPGLTSVELRLAADLAAVVAVRPLPEPSA